MMLSKLRSFGICAGIVACVAATNSSASGAEVLLPEAYGFADVQAHDVFDESPLAQGLSFGEDSSAVSNPLNRTPADATASASAYGDAFGPFGVTAAISSHASNPDPAGWNDVVATASSANLVQYVVSPGNGSLQPGDTVRARLAIHFKGTIEITNGNPPDPNAFGSLAYIFTDTQVGQNRGPMDIVHEGECEFTPGGERFEWGDFQGHGVFTDDPATGRRAAAYDFTDVVEFDTAVGATVELSFNYWADASVDGILNVSALIDFSAGTTYTLTAADAGTGAQFVAVVPEPAALSVIALGAVAGMRRRRLPF